MRYGRTWRRQPKTMMRPAAEIISASIDVSSKTVVAMPLRAVIPLIPIIAVVDADIAGSESYGSDSRHQIDFVLAPKDVNLLHCLWR